MSAPHGFSPQLLAERTLPISLQPPARIQTPSTRGIRSLRCSSGLHPHDSEPEECWVLVWGFSFPLPYSGVWRPGHQCWSSAGSVFPSGETLGTPAQVHSSAAGWGWPGLGHVLFQVLPCWPLTTSSSPGWREGGRWLWLCAVALAEQRGLKNSWERL